MPKNILILLFSATLLVQGCSVAKLSDFPASSREIDFNKCPVDTVTTKGSRRTSETTNKYCIERTKAYTEAEILKAIDKAFKLNGFSVIKFYRPDIAVFE